MSCITENLGHPNPPRICLCVLNQLTQVKVLTYSLFCPDLAPLQLAQLLLPPPSFAFLHLELLEIEKGLDFTRMTRRV